MNNLLRFSDYDFFAYLVSGFVAMAMWDALFSTQLVIGAEWSFSDGLLVILAAYVTGQIVASPASLVLERWLVRRVLGRPSDVLMATVPPTGWRAFMSRVFLSDYFMPLDATIADSVRLAVPEGGSLSGEGLFWQAYATARTDEASSVRLDGFLRLYGFCRNLAFVALLGTAAFLIAALAGAIARAPIDMINRYWTLTGVSLVVAVGMTQRYLKFHRLFTLEAFLVLANRSWVKEKPRNEG